VGVSVDYRAPTTREQTGRVAVSEPASYIVNTDAYRALNRCEMRRWSPAMTTDRIEINPNVMMGKPVIKGTRITVELVLRKLAEGATEADLRDAYPRLTGEDIRAAIANKSRE